ncbi:alkanesulfonate monooxygenase [Paraburkholderia fungorum]|uniref:Alkanesulfonate monooxygenase n=1 Tax=Paraburkholderia fungorum TaxID=134537 RepID=A0A1H1K0G2_9BURK|nr:LLM class flavin-dependent oxidoreductase [Paraburkholderia fungorum]SDR55407.1 alkanesulfonate monooxygenase [Paraburkholderia fungorum]
MSQARQIRLATLFNANGFHIAGWRHPDTQSESAWDIDHYASIIKTAERGLFDLAFLTDSVGMLYDGDLEVASRFAPINFLEPLTLLSALAPQTTHIGLVATASTSYNHPYHVARKFASIDHLSKGRAGWNLVTSATNAEARNFGRDSHLEHADRYVIAKEFFDVVVGLWNSWTDDAVLADKDAGVYFDPNKLKLLNHRGDHFSVKGPLNVFRSAQGHPVLVQAGSSEAGIALGAETAEVIFTAQHELDGAVQFYSDVKSRAVQHGRAAEDLLILPGIVPFIGRSREEAQETFEKIQGLIHPVVGVRLLSELLGIDLSTYPVDGPLPPLPESNGHKARQALLIETARRENLSIRALYERAAGARGHRILIGTPIDIADDLEHWFTSAAADGFAVIPPILPSSLESFVTLVVPELQRRGLYRQRYQYTTLRENLGLPTKTQHS